MPSECPTVTLRQVAREAGVSHTTVSLALRNDPEIPAETRRRIALVAHRLGYQRDPRLAELMRHVRLHSGRRAAQRETIAFVAGSLRDADSATFASAAADCAAELGYRVDRMALESTGSSPRRLPDVLAARGIRGVVLGPLKGFGLAELALDGVAMVGLDAGATPLRLRRVVHDHFGAVHSSFSRLVDYGYRRIGLAMDPAFQVATGGQARAAFWDCVEGSPASQRVSPFIGPRVGAPFAAWLATERPDAIIVPDAAWAAEAAQAGRRVPEDLACAVLDGTGSDGLFGGIMPDRGAMSRCAIEMLAGLLEQNCVSPPSEVWAVLHDGVWRDGRSVPRRRPGPPAEPCFPSLQASGGAS